MRHPSFLVCLQRNRRKEHEEKQSCLFLDGCTCFAGYGRNANLISHGHDPILSTGQAQQLKKCRMKQYVAERFLLFTTLAAGQTREIAKQLQVQTTAETCWKLKL